MGAYRLVDAGYPTFKKIVHNRKWVGRVCKIKVGFLGIIGKTEAKGATEKEAFEEVVAQHLGYNGSASLHAKNQMVRQANNARAAPSRRLAREFVAGDLNTKIEIIDSLFERMNRELKGEK